jgi:hypothetical protein
MMWNIMRVGGALRQVATYLEECEQAPAVEGVDLIECSESGDGLSARFELTVSYPSTDGGAMELCASSLNADGTLRLGFETAQPVVPDTAESLNVTPRDATLTTEGHVCVEFTASLDSDVPASKEESSAEVPSARTTGDAPPEATSGSHRTAEDSDSKRDSDVPAFKNPELLQSVYESCDTFAEMAETLEMDVTAEGVESGTQVRRLQGMECPTAQGFYFSRPLRARDAESLLKEDRLPADARNGGTENAGT